MPDWQNNSLQTPAVAFAAAAVTATVLLQLQSCCSPDDKIDVVVGDGDDHVGDVVRSIQVALHGGPAGAVECSGEWAGLPLASKSFRRGE